MRPVKTNISSEICFLVHAVALPMTETFSKIWRRVVLSLGKEGERTTSVTAAVENEMVNKVLARTTVESKRQPGKCESPPTAPQNIRGNMRKELVLPQSKRW